MFVLFDTFNNKTISRHRTPDAAAKAKSRFANAIRKHSPDAYIPVKLMVESVDEKRRIKLVEPSEDDCQRFADVYCEIA
jgi:hypothetical protein